MSCESYLLELWEDFMFLAEMMLRERTASAAVSSTSGLFLIRPESITIASIKKNQKYAELCQFAFYTIQRTHRPPAPGRLSSGAHCPSRG